MFAKSLTPTTGTDLRTYNKNGQLWYIAYAPVPTTDYSLAVVVPEDDIIGPAVFLQNAILAQSNLQIYLLIGILIAAFVIMFAIVVDFLLQPEGSDGVGIYDPNLLDRFVFKVS